MKAIAIAYITLIVIIFTGWASNLYKLTQCDFKAPFKAEVIHAVGVVPIVGAFTGWMDFGK